MGTVNDLVTRLVLDNKGFDSNLAKSTKQVQNFQMTAQSVGSKFSSGLGVLSRFVPQLAVLAGGFSTFNATIKGSETLIDKWGETTKVAESSVNHFFTSLANGNLSNFTDGLMQVVQAARETYQAVDALGTLTNFQDAELAQINARKQEIRYEIKLGRKEGKTEEELQPLVDELLGTDEKIADLAKEKADAAMAAFEASMNEAFSGDKSISASGYKFKISEDYVKEQAKIWTKWDNGNQTGFKYIDDEVKKATKEVERLNKEFSKNPSSVSTSQALINARKYLEVITFIKNQEEKIVEANKYKTLAANAIASSYTQRMESIESMSQAKTTGNTSTKTETNKPQPIPIKFGESISDVEEQLARWNKIYKQAGDEAGRAYAQSMIDAIKAKLDNMENFQPLKQADENFAVDFSKATEGMTKTSDKVKETNNDMALLSTMTSAWSGAIAGTGETGAAQFAQILSSIIPLISAVGALAVAEGTEKAARTSKNWIEAIVAAGTVTATIISAIAAGKKQTKYADGGIVSSGSISGDHNLVRVNGGEMILNGTQQSNLFRLLNAPDFNNKQSMGGQVEFKLRGQELVGLINNVNHKNSRII